jgi:PAS domain S-box-containing protein
MTASSYHKFAEFFYRKSQRPWLRQVIVPLSIALTLVIKLLLTPLLSNEGPFLLFFVPIFISAWLGGYRAGLGATLLIAVLVDLLLLAPVGSLFINDAAQLSAIVLFVLEGWFISWLIGLLDHSFRYAAEQATLAERQIAEIHLRQQAEAELNERLRIATEMHASEARYRTLVEHLPNIVILMFDRQMRYLLVDGSALERHGYNKAAMEGQTLAEIVPPERLAYLQPAYQAALRGETMLLKHERDGFTYRSQFVPVRGDDGTIIGGMAVVEDTTMQTQSERILRASEHRFQAFMDHSPTLAWITDGEGVVHFANQTLQRTTAYQSEAFLGRNISELLGAQYADTHLAHIQQVAASGVALEVVESAPRRDGGVSDYLVYKFPIATDQGRLVGGIGIDITAQRLIETQLRSSLQEKEVLLREIHHRVKNNLQLIISLLRLQAGSISDGQLQEQLLEAQQRIRAIALVHEKLYQETSLAQVDIASYIRTLSIYMTRSYGNRSECVQVSTHIDDLRLSIDQAVPCGLIIHELVANAFKHAFPVAATGQIIISVRRVAGFIELVVDDSGIGMTSEQFVPTEQSLGMQLLLTFTEQLAGSMEHLPGPGTTIRVRFPYEG